MIFDQKSSKVQKVPKRVLDGKSISAFARKRQPVGLTCDTPPGSASRALVPIADPMAEPTAQGHKNAEHSLFADDEKRLNDEIIL